MARSVAGLLAGGVATGLLLIAAGQSPAHGDDGKPVVAGSFNVKVNVGKSELPDGFKSQPGIRTYTFGSGCRLGSSKCALTQSTPQGGTETSPLTTMTGGVGSNFSEKLDCLDTVTGAVSTPGGADHTIVMRLMPTATTVRDGVTYVTEMRGTIDNNIVVNARGRANNCTIPPNNSLFALEHSTLRATLVPLSVPPTTTSPVPVRLADDTAPTKGTIPAFELPQTARQATSAAAVASGSRSSVPGALVTPSEAIRTVGDRLPQVLLLVALLGLLIIFPAQLFNSTYEENHERIDRQLARLRLRRRAPAAPATVNTLDPTVGPPGPEATSVPGPAVYQGDSVAAAVPPPTAPPRSRRIAIFFGCVVVGTLLGGLLDPNFGANRPSYALMIGIFASVLVAVLVAAFAGRLFRSATHHASSWYLRAIPSALLIAVACVLVSRLTHFQPGYLYGVLGGAVFAVALDKRSEGRAEVAAAGAGLVIALLAWIAFGPVARAADGADPAFWLLSVDAFLAALFIGGLEGLLFGLIPLRFLPGFRVKAWSWIVWGALMFGVLFAFVHVLLLPESGYLGRSTAASVTVTLALFVGFGVLSGLFWLYFRLRPAAEEADAPERAVAPAQATPDGATPGTPESLTGPEAARITVDAQGQAVPGTGPKVPRQGPPSEES